MGLAAPVQVLKRQPFTVISVLRSLPVSITMPMPLHPMLPTIPTRCIVCWDKEQPWENFSQVELAWTSFDMPAKMFRKGSRGGSVPAMRTVEKIHPTQKPVELYAYLLRVFAKPGDSIFDPMMGSQSSRIAAYMMGFDYVGCELDADYFTKGCERFNRECKGIYVSPNGRRYRQLSLFE